MLQLLSSLHDGDVDDILCDDTIPVWLWGWSPRYQESPGVCSHLTDALRGSSWNCKEEACVLDTVVLLQCTAITRFLLVLTVYNMLV